MYIHVHTLPPASKLCLPPRLVLLYMSTMRKLYTPVSRCIREPWGVGEGVRGRVGGLVAVYTVSRAFFADGAARGNWICCVCACVCVYYCVWIKYSAREKKIVFAVLTAPHLPGVHPSGTQPFVRVTRTTSHSHPVYNIVAAVSSPTPGSGCKGRNATLVNLTTVQVIPSRSPKTDSCDR